MVKCRCKKFLCSGGIGDDWSDDVAAHVRTAPLAARWGGGGAVCARAPVRESGDEQRAARTVPPPDVLHRRHRAPLEQDALPTAC